MTDQLVVGGWNEYATREERDTVLTHLIDMAIATREEDGCIEYLVAADPTHEGRLVLFELWESKEQHDVHLDSPHVVAFREAITGLERIAKGVAGCRVSE